MGNSRTRIALLVLLGVLMCAVGALVVRSFLGQDGSASSVTSTDEEVMQVASSQGADASSAGADSQLNGNPETESEFVRAVREGEYRTIRLVGDSITAGFGADGFENPDLAASGAVIYDDGAGTVHYEPAPSIECWANAFRAWATEQGAQGFVNAGICGWFMHDLVRDPNAWLGEGADVIVVALGTNDAGYYGPQVFADDARAALAAAERVSKLVVVIAPVADLRPHEMLVEPAAELGDILQGICDERGYVFVDPRDAVMPQMFCDDGLHPTSEGSLAIWQCIRTTLGLDVR